MNRPRFLMALLVLPLLFAACSTDNPTALSVGDTTVSVSEVNTDVEFLRANPDTALNVFGVDTTQEPWVPQAQATILSVLASSELFTQAAADNDAEVTDQDRVDAREQLTSLITVDMPDSLNESIVDLLAATRAIERKVAETIGEPTDTEIEERYGQFIAATDFSQYICMDQMFVASTSDTPSDQDRADAQQRLDDFLNKVASGEEFAAAASELSDTSVAFGCLNSTELTEEFSLPSANLQVGEISDPFETSFGLHVLYMTNRGEPALPLVYEAIKQELLVERQNEGLTVDAVVRDTAANVTVTVDPLYGVWDAETLQVVPPEG